MKGDLSGNPAIGLHQIDLIVPVSITIEGDPASIRRKLGAVLICRMGRQLLGVASLRSTRPNISSPSKGDSLPVGTYRWRGRHLHDSLLRFVQ